MALDPSKLQNVKKSGGKTTARCPACAATGGDSKGEHLVMFPDGKFACVVNPKDNVHRKEIFALVGLASDGPTTGRISVNIFKVPQSAPVMDLGRFERFRPKPVITKAPEASSEKREKTKTTNPQ